jgi:pterin-4a-carbinolamine dehydratase
MEEQDQMQHHARMTIDENEIHVEIYTKDLNTITESDHHLARLADLIFMDTAR